MDTAATASDPDSSPGDPGRDVASASRVPMWLVGVGVLSVLALAFALGRSNAGDAASQVSTPEVRAQSWYPVEVVDVGDLAGEVVVERDLPIELRDGVRLSATVFRPVGEARHPVVMAFTAYGKDGGPDSYPTVLELAARPEFDLGTITVSDWTTWEGPDPAFWTANGYAVVYVDSRGFGDSGGEATILSVQDREDFADAIEWAGTRPWSNGNVGLTGVSYLAISQWVAASGNPEHLEAIIPWEGQTDSYREVLYHGGIPETAFTTYWSDRMRTLGDPPPLPPAVAFRFAHERPRVMRFFQDRIADPSGIVLSSIEVPALVAATWSDQGLHTRGSFRGFEQISSDQKWLFTHGRSKWETYYSDEALEVQLAFFDHFLKGEDNGFESRPPVRLEVRETRESYEVRDEDGWPIPRTDYQQWFLDAATGSLLTAAPTAESVVTYDAATGGADFAITFDRDVELSGHMALRLWVSTDAGDDLDLFVAVEKRDVDGDPVHFLAKTGFTEGPVAMGWLRVSERELDEAASTPWQPVLAHERSLPVSPGEVVPVDVEILPSSTLFRAGESLVLRVQGRDLFDHPLLQHELTVNEGTHAVHTGGEYDAHILVPVIPPLGDGAG